MGALRRSSGGWWRVYVPYESASLAGASLDSASLAGASGAFSPSSGSSTLITRGLRLLPNDFMAGWDLCLLFRWLFAGRFRSADVNNLGGSTLSYQHVTTRGMGC